MKKAHDPIGRSAITDSYVALKTAQLKLRESLNKIEKKYDPHYADPLMKEMRTLYGELELADLGLFAAVIRTLDALEDILLKIKSQK